MNETGDTRRYMGKWTPERGFEPLDLENLVQPPPDGREAFYYHGLPEQVGVTQYVDSVVETLEDLAIEAARLDARLNGTSKIEIAPGFGLLRFLGSIVPRSFRERELEALHADAIELYFEKLEAGEKWAALRVKWSMRAWMLWTVFGGAAGAVFSMLVGKHKSSK